MVMKSFMPDPERDIPLIRQLTKAELKPEDVYCCRIVLADNDIDRDGEQFSPAALKSMAELFVGKPGIMDHSWSARDQIARVYRTSVETTKKRNSAGEPLVELVADVYILRAGNDRLIADIEGGILREVSVGVRGARPVCTICGSRRHECEHSAGGEYGGKTCWFRFDEIEDAFEFSFVPVPAQRGAGVRKCYDPRDPANEFLRRLEAGAYDRDERVLSAAAQGIRAAALRDGQRKALIEENAKYMKR